MPPKKKDSSTEVISDRKARFNALKTSYGDVGRIHEIAPVDQATCLRSPSPSLNILTNEVGFRPGSIVEWYGEEGTMKTYLALQMALAAQEQFPDQAVAYFDPEQAVDLFAAEHRIGVHMEQLDADIGLRRFEYYPDPKFDQMPTLEELLNRINSYAASGLFSLIILDSLAATSSLYEAEQDDITKDKAFGPAQILSKSFKKIKATCARTGTRIWVINQVRTKTVQGPTGPIAKIEPGGGYALRFAATHRFNVKWVQKERESDGSKLRIYAEKVKYGPPFRGIEVPFIFGRGVDAASDLVQIAAKAQIIDKSGSWYSYKGEKLGQGLENAGDAISEDKTLFDSIAAASYAVLCPQETNEKAEADV